MVLAVNSLRSLGAVDMKHVGHTSGSKRKAEEGDERQDVNQSCRLHKYFLCVNVCKLPGFGFVTVGLNQAQWLKPTYSQDLRTLF